MTPVMQVGAGRAHAGGRHRDREFNSVFDQVMAGDRTCAASGKPLGASAPRGAALRRRFRAGSTRASRDEPVHADDVSSSWKSVRGAATQPTTLARLAGSQASRPGTSLDDET